jgi:hypothetical protein
MPKEIAIAVPNRTSSSALASAIQRGQIPIMSVTPRNNSAAVAAQARNGIVDAGMKEVAVADVAAGVEAEAIGDAGQKCGAQGDAGVKNAQPLERFRAGRFRCFARFGCGGYDWRVAHCCLPPAGLL